MAGWRYSEGRGFEFSFFRFIAD